MVPVFFRLTFLRFLWLLLAYSICRALHLLLNWSTYSETAGFDLFKAFVYGLRFDVAAIMITNLALMSLWLLPSVWTHTKTFRRIDLSLFALVNFFFLGLNFIDFDYVNFIGKRLSYELLFIRDDVERQSFSILATYWYLFIGLLMLTAALVYLIPRFPTNLEKRSSRKKQKLQPWLPAVGWRALIVIAIVIGVRGGFQFKPLHPMHAYFSTHQELGLLTLNTPFNLIRSKPRGEVERTRFFSDDRHAIERLQKMTSLTRPPLALARGWNVVIIILESFSTEFTGIANSYKGYTPQFDALAKQSYYFKYNFANARRSIEGLPAVLCGIPAIMAEPVITSDFSNNRFECLPKVLGREGYQTYFLHGAHNGSMHFDTFSKIAGFENFVGLNEYPKDDKTHFDKYWGVLDEPMLQYAAKILDESKKPALVSVFTLSSHHPYYVPPKYEGKFSKGTLEIHESIGYTDHALGQFFETAKTKDWFNNTIFVVTADHTQKTDQPEYKNFLGYYRVPMMIYVPGLKKKITVDPNRITQHIDVIPSVLDLLGLQTSEKLLVGQSVFDSKKSGRAYNFAGPYYWLMDSQRLIQFFKPPKETQFFKHSLTRNLETVAPTKDFQESLQDLHAVIHYLNNGLVRNSLYSWKESL